MLRDSIAILSSTQPPSPKAVKQAVADANALICAMETELGLPHRYPVLTSTMAIKRLKELEAMKAANLSGTPQAPVSIETELGSSYHHLTQASARSAALVEQVKARKQSKLPDSSLAPTTTPPSKLTALPPAAASSSAASTATNDGIPRATLSEFLKMDAATRKQYCQDGGTLPLADFNKLSETAKGLFCSQGGRILENRLRELSKSNEKH